MGSLLITNDPVALAREFEAHSAQWKALRESLRQEVEKWKAAVSARAEWDDMAASAALSTCAHTAYHFGAIRQILAGLNG